MKFVELNAGKRIILGPAQVDEEEIIAFAKKYDAQWFHTDPIQAKQGPWDRQCRRPIRGRRIDGRDL